MTEETVLKALDLMDKIKWLKERHDLNGAGDNHATVQNLAVEFVDAKEYNRLKAEKLAKLEKKFADL